MSSEKIGREKSEISDVTGCNARTTIAWVVMKFHIDKLSLKQKDIHHNADRTVHMLSAQN